MQIVTVRIDAGLVAAVLFVKLFYEEPAALWAVLVDRLKVADEITLWIVGTAVEGFAASLCFAFYNVAATVFARTFCQRNRLCVVTLREARTCKEVTKASELLYHWLTAKVALKVGLLVQKALDAFLSFHNFVYTLFEWTVKILHHGVPDKGVVFYFIKLVFYFGGKGFVYNIRERLNKNLRNNFSKLCRNQLFV